MATLLLALCDAAAAQTSAPAERWSPAAVNAGFLAHLGTLGSEFAVPVAAVRAAYAEASDNAGAALLLDALGLLYPEFAAGLARYDTGDLAGAEAAFARLADSSDPFLESAAAYLHARVLVQRSRNEEALPLLQSLTGPARAPGPAAPFTPHALLLRAHCEAATLDGAAAQQTLARLTRDFAAAPEPVNVAARQLSLELERAERGSLAQVSGLMTYAAERLGAADPGDKTRGRQGDAIALLDELIAQAQQSEQQKSASRRQGGKRGAQQNTPPQRPAEHSDAPQGAGDIGDQHAAPAIAPGEVWGKLPPAERERILQALRDRFPSRYRQLVEQYYRSLAEQK